MPASSIGAFTFVRMDPQPLPAGERLVPESRAGVDGTAWWDVGEAGEEYTVQTVVDVADWSTAVALAAAYRAAQAAGPLAVSYGGVACGSVIVRGVHGVAEATLLGIGGVAGESRACVRATWKLCAV